MTSDPTDLAAIRAEVERLREALQFYAGRWHRTVERNGSGQTIALESGRIRIEAEHGRAIAPDSPLLDQHRTARRALGMSEMFGPEDYPLKEPAP